MLYFYIDLQRRFKTVFEKRPNILADINLILDKAYYKKHGYVFKSLDDLLNKIADCFQVSVIDIKDKDWVHENKQIVKMLFCYQAKLFFYKTYTLEQIGDIICVGKSWVHNLIATFVDEIEEKNHKTLTNIKIWEEYCKKLNQNNG